MHRSIAKSLKAKGENGFTLVEVLIALIVISVGMLGIAGLYLHSIQAGRTSVFRHHAITLAGDVADRIRANPAAGAGYASAATDTGADRNCVNGGINCTPADMALNDIWDWQQQADATLPNGGVAVAFTDGGGIAPDRYTITVGWTEAGLATAPQYVIQIPVNDFTGP